MLGIHPTGIPLPDIKPCKLTQELIKTLASKVTHQPKM